jgi:hypothetical protein
VAATLILSACAGEQVGNPARFNVSTQVRFDVDTQSVILYTECGSNFSRLAGVANATDDAVILHRNLCGEDWWYEIQVGALKNEEWKGIGWVPESKLKTK